MRYSIVWRESMKRLGYPHTRKDFKECIHFTEKHFKVMDRIRDIYYSNNPLKDTRRRDGYINLTVTVKLRRELERRFFNDNH
jgi:hypothetical protein